MSDHDAQTGGNTMSQIEQRTMKKVFRRLVPFLMFCYFFNFLDRVNVSFAALDMNKDLGFSASVFGFGSGILFLAYMLCETPSNVLLTRFGARKWLARIMVSWGIIASSMVFITGEFSFYTLRVLLGAAEAGFFPGIIYYLTLWFPGVYRARVTGLFMACIPLSAALGSPLSTSLLYLDGILGLRGWQWLFLLEGIPSILLGVTTFFYLTERPRYATGWLAQDERDWLDGRLTAEHDRKQAELSLGMWQTLINPRVLVLSVVAYCLASITLGVGFFLPLIVKEFGLTNMQTGLVAIIPPAFGAAAMIWWGRKSDRAMERKYHLFAVMALAAIGIAAAAFVNHPVLKMACLTLSAMGVYASSPVFWTLAPNFLTGPSAAVGIAFINSVAALGAFVAPWLIGLIKDATGSFSYGLLMLAALVTAGGFLVLSIEHDIVLEHAPEQPLADLA
jgi:ACS family tartrate transporter-like MFS transporter